MRLAAAILAVASGALALSGAGAELPGKAKARICATCHGPLGVAIAPDAPNLAGQPRMYLAAQLNAFRSGKRAHEQMNVIAKTLSDADIAELADWYSSITVNVKEPPEK